MAMFRRRTDHIYATLQQVQRRITQGTEPGTASQSAEPPPESETPVTPPPSIREASRALTGGASPGGYLVMPDGTRHATGDGDEASAGAGAEGGSAAATHESGAGYEQPASASGGAAANLPPTRATASRAEPQAGIPSRRLELSFELVLIVLVLWLGSVAAAYLAGHSQGGDGESATTDNFFADGEGQSSGSGDGSGRQGSQGPSPSPGAGGTGQQSDGGAGMILVLSSVARSSSQALEEFNGLAEEYNQIARDRGYQPWFGVRRTSSGGLQFIYGQVGDRYGIRMQDPGVQQLFRELKSQPDYQEAFWQQAR